MALSQNVIPRSEWGAMPPRFTEPMNTPITRVLFSAENEVPACTTRETCTELVRGIQKHYMDKGMDDIPYNFVVGNDGNVYEGRGWHTMPNPAIRVNSMFLDNTIDIGVICGHKEISIEKMDMVRDAFKAAETFVKQGVKEKVVAEDYQFRGFTDDIEPDEEEEVKEKQKPKEQIAG